MGVEGADESGEQSMRLASGYSSKFGYDTAVGEEPDRQ